ncbi:hypothetical protein BDV95DRAFT_598896 [Massariosphaeria phaeospora]|uniref:Uncharacterized protein n=1 Tax=Massariosphaeria phaeospora TaxID=100035 RepID=A0A7C8I2F0_9PLEO|nr:hypothetical protein BDV95DRAFT_598896 [Massariosphaeria phaeospora]
MINTAPGNHTSSPPKLTLRQQWDILYHHLETIPFNQTQTQTPPSLWLSSLDRNVLLTALAKHRSELALLLSTSPTTSPRRKSSTLQSPNHEYALGPRNPRFPPPQIAPELCGQHQHGGHGLHQQHPRHAGPLAPAHAHHHASPHDHRRSDSQSHIRAASTSSSSSSHRLLLRQQQQPQPPVPPTAIAITTAAKHPAVDFDVDAPASSPASPTFGPRRFHAFSGTVARRRSFQQGAAGSPVEGVEGGVWHVGRDVGVRGCRSHSMSERERGLEQRILWEAAWKEIEARLEEYVDRFGGVGDAEMNRKGNQELWMELFMLRSEREGLR